MWNLEKKLKYIFHAIIASFGIKKSSQDDTMPHLVDLLTNSHTVTEPQETKFLISCLVPQKPTTDIHKEV